MTHDASDASDVSGVPKGRRLALLEGVTVLDVTGFLAGPFASMIFADLGEIEAALARRAAAILR